MAFSMPSIMSPNLAALEEGRGFNLTSGTGKDNSEKNCSLSASS